MLGAEEGAGEIDGDGIIPPGLGHIRARAGLAERAGIVESDIEPAKFLDGECYQGLCVSLGAHVPRQCDGIPAIGLDFADQARQLGLAPGAHDELGSLRRKQFRRHPANAGAGARNERYLILQTSHSGTPARRDKARRRYPSIISLSPSLSHATRRGVSF